MKKPFFELSLAVLLLMTSFVNISKTNKNENIIQHELQRQLLDSRSKPAYLRKKSKGSKHPTTDVKFLIDLHQEIVDKDAAGFDRAMRTKLKLHADSIGAETSKWESNLTMYNDIIEAYHFCSKRLYHFKLMVTNKNELDKDSVELEIKLLNVIEDDENIEYFNGDKRLSEQEVKSFYGLMKQVKAKITSPATNDFEYIHSVN